MPARDEPIERRGTEPVESIDLAEHAQELASARAAGRQAPAGRLLGLPELPGGDVWVDTAGASAVTGIAPKTITGWLTRGGPKALPFPAPHRFLYRNHWPLSELEDWAQAYRAESRT
ncbi:helix-turn-helix transcriptional regulator [Actinomadura sp. WAC 06369]|uniref:helix-turn-helix transcriptional regulator n=1 Tax=Actinomadura sp. WAC 06369 TaxID=2203193 RepID=UPI000F78181C|nr:hypothetical protein [Actinomadura sp. WAC 06369]RSN46565.1 hypothetical protein DMH08_35715 [Actinomadura sp. WAC 06369]